VYRSDTTCANQASPADETPGNNKHTCVQRNANLQLLPSKVRDIMIFFSLIKGLEI